MAASALEIDSNCDFIVIPFYVLLKDVMPVCMHFSPVWHLVSLQMSRSDRAATSATRLAVNGVCIC